MLAENTVFTDAQIQARLKAARGAIVKSKTELAQHLKVLSAEGGLAELEDAVPSGITLHARREYIGCQDRIAAVCFGAESTRFGTASHDGKFMIWDANSGLKQYCIRLKSTFVMACALQRGGRAMTSKLAATGGMDNTVSLYDVTRPALSAAANTPVALLEDHDGYISDLQFFSSEKVLSTGGDGKCIMWDIESQAQDMTCKDHVGDALCVAVAPKGIPIFATGSVDSKVHVYDSRVGLVQTFMGQIGDVNAISFFPDGQAIGSGCSDGSVALYDLRAGQAIATYGRDSRSSGVGGLGFSLSGRLLLVGSEDGFVRVFDTVPQSSEATNPSQSIKAHDLGITSVAVAPDGSGILTGSDDSSAKMWA